jgi:hypothetical protein
MICRKCKSLNTEDAKFCNQCGFPFEREINNKPIFESPINKSVLNAGITIPMSERKLFYENLITHRLQRIFNNNSKGKIEFYSTNSVGEFLVKCKVE